jgi:hypothetical protein
MRQCKSPRRQSRQCGAQHRAAHPRRQGHGRAQRAAPWAEPAGARRPGACGRGRRAGAADRRGGRERAAPRRRAAHRRGASRRRAHPSRAHADHDRRIRRPRPHRPADAARPLRAQGVVATKVGNPGIRWFGAPGRAAAPPQSVGRRRGRREAAGILAERSQCPPNTRSMGRRRRRRRAARISAEQTRFVDSHTQTVCFRCRRACIFPVFYRRRGAANFKSFAADCSARERTPPW